MRVKSRNSSLNCIFESSESEAQESDVSETQPLAEESFVPGLPLKSDHSAKPKVPRRPAGGLSRPLPSPGKIPVLFCFILYTVFIFLYNSLTYKS